MKRICQPIQKMIAPYLRAGALILEDGSRHAKVRSPLTHDFLPLAATSGDPRAIKNFKSELKRLLNHGEGLVYCRTGRLPPSPTCTHGWGQSFYTTAKGR